MRFQFVIPIFFLLLVVIMPGCNPEPASPPVVPPASTELKSLDTIPGEFIIDFIKSVNDIQRDSFKNSFKRVYREAIIRKYGVIYDNLNPIIQFYEEQCDCIDAKSLYSLRFRIDTSSAGGNSSSINPEEHEASEESIAFNGVGPEGRCLTEEHEAGEDDITWAGLSPEESVLDSLIDTLSWVEDIRPNRFIKPPSNSQFDFGECYTDLNNYPESQESDMIIAIIDSGLDPCLFATYASERKIWASTEESRCIAETGRIFGWNFIDGNDDIDDELGHGTKVTGVLDQTLNGRVSTSCHSKYMLLKIFTECYGSTYHASCAIDFALTNGADVVNGSWGIYDDDVDIRRSLGYTETYNTPFICSAGNEQRILGLPEGIEHLPSDASHESDNNMILAISGLMPSGLELWGWNVMTGAAGAADRLLPVPEEGGTNLYAKKTNLCEPAEVELEISLLTGYETEFTVVGTSFSAPQATAKVAAHLCCWPTGELNRDLFDRANSTMSSELGTEIIAVLPDSPLHDVKLRRLRWPDRSTCHE